MVPISQRRLTAHRSLDDESMDAAVSISALERNSPADLPSRAFEFLRVLKPGGCVIATAGAAKERDWFHEPSQGWCLTKRTLRRVFALPDDCPPSFAGYDAVFDGAKTCETLRVDLGGSYFLSGDDGMPWGVWDPKYLSAGAMRTK
jgi:hypothetical protein